MSIHATSSAHARAHIVYTVQNRDLGASLSSQSLLHLQHPLVTSSYPLAHTHGRRRLVLLLLLFLFAISSHHHWSSPSLNFSFRSGFIRKRPRPAHSHSTSWSILKHSQLIAFASRQTTSSLLVPRRQCPFAFGHRSFSETQKK